MSYFFCFFFCSVSLFSCNILVCTVFLSFLFEDLLEDRPFQAEGAFLHKIKITYIHTYVHTLVVSVVNLTGEHLYIFMHV